MDHFRKGDFSPEPESFNAYLEYVLSLEKNQNISFFLNEQDDTSVINLESYYDKIINRFYEDQNGSNLKHELFYKRTQKAVMGKRLIDFKGELLPVNIYTTDNLLDLAWVEILHALNHTLYARICADCENVFNVQRPYTGMTCSLKCYMRNYRKEFVGGEKGFKAKRATDRRLKRQMAKQKITVVK